MLWARFEKDMLLMKPHILFRWAHPPLSIPRHVVTAHEKKGLLRRFIAFHTTADERLSFHMYERQFGWPEDVERTGS
jgi:hypothetical protein